MKPASLYLVKRRKLQPRQQIEDGGPDNKEVDCRVGGQMLCWKDECLEVKMVENFVNKE